MPYQRYRVSQWRLINFGCAVLSIVVIFLLSFYAIILLKMAGDKRFQRKMEQAVKLQKCKENLRELCKALERYKEGTGDYPQKLSELIPLYLKKPDFLHCPNDPSPIQVVSYQYTKPPRYDPDFVVIICDHHPNLLALHMNGKVEVVYRRR